jgi:lipopolysaccharide transport system ATP-binding protein
MSTVIKVENLSKSYRLGSISTGSLHKDLQSFWARVRGKEDPNRRLGEKVHHAKDELFWALKDVSFEIQQGDIVGIIGRNGAGKSTLLKILSRITAPTQGSVKVRGRIASLLEVGTGFHPELTGRENVFLNGAILGMTRREIERKFDEIVDFAEIEQFIDTPVKRYSSGMYVRLAFAVAAHLESEILIVDEVLAVGDAAFQKKCLGKMSEVAKADRTVLFVSHNMNALSTLCNQGILLGAGQLRLYSNARHVIDEYLNRFSKSETFWLASPDKAYRTEFTELLTVSILQNGMQTQMPTLSKSFQISITFRIYKAMRATVSIHLLDQIGSMVLSSANIPSAIMGTDPLAGSLYAPGEYVTNCHIPAQLLNEAYYSVNVVILSGVNEVHINANELISFKTLDDTNMRQDYGGSWGGAIRPQIEWRTKMLNP